ncbi:GIY-YIG nuclease family protein [Companilactobacillus insicii]|uniref:GIY-YIG nuclease family protein n=1 Tax=Companilactobacillus insicii TaxID=1732567 RepID=UPI000F76F406|nr:GIY-YIG nuclease family protein [Companilactobacillus insicii]
MANNEYFVYILLCADKTFYIGTSNNVTKRVATHNLGKGAKYTKTRLPVKLMYKEKLHSKSEALKREIELKKFSRKKKELFLRSHGINWQEFLIS